MRGRHLAGPLAGKLTAHGQRRFAGGKAWNAHLGQGGLTGLETAPDPVRAATLGRLLKRLRAGRAELLNAPGHPKMPLHASGPGSDFRRRGQPAWNAGRPRVLPRLLRCRSAKGLPLAVSL